MQTLQPYLNFYIAITKQDRIIKLISSERSISVLSTHIYLVYEGFIGLVLGWDAQWGGLDVHWFW